MTSVSPRTASEAVLKGLVHLFYSDASVLGRFRAVLPASLPPAYRQLLDHQHHMTVSVETFYGEPIDVQVLEYHHDARHYWRRILLTRRSDSRVVQFGIVRLDLAALQKPVRDAIRNRRTPLGRILIQHGVLRQVELLGLWKVDMGDELRRLLPAGEEVHTFGRTARIHCNGEPAVELLEIVAPIADGGGSGG